MTQPDPLAHPHGWNVWPKPPAPQLIRDARTYAGLTQAQAGQLVHVTVRTWQKWEKGDAPMRPGYWALFVDRARAYMAADLETAGKPDID